MHVQRSSGGRLTKDQTTRSVFVVWVVFYYLAFRHCFTQLLHSDVPDDALVDGVLGQLKLIRCDPLA